MAAKYTFLVLLITATILQLSFGISLPSDATYHAGVVEFKPSQDASKSNRVKDNLQRMKQIIESDDTKDLDIIVFPEFVLNNNEWPTNVPDPAWGIAPCDVPNTHFFLTELSCAARSRSLYVVINVMEKEFCANNASMECDVSGMNSYNTNVVFDRQGRVISRYRKTHLYRSEWYTVNVLAKPELATFKTDFGVTFGHFICFDMLFYEPAQVLVKELKITDIIYPTYWFSELPFLGAVQLQEGWAYANDVNLLAADASNPSGQNTGSGIYAGKFGRLSAVAFEDPTTQLLKARVPKHAHRANYTLPPVVLPVFVPQLETKRFTKLNLLRDYNVDIFTTKLLPDNFLNATETLCHGEFCCKFDVRRTFIADSTMYSAYRYRLAVYSGAQTTHQRVDPSELSVCAVIACTNIELYTCGYIFPEGVRVGNKYYFNSINVSGSFRNAERRLIMPSSVDAVMMPVAVSMYDMTEVQSTNGTDVSITLTSPKLDILTFGIWANYYSKAVSNHNVDPPRRNNAIAILSSNIKSLLIIVMAADYFIFKLFK